MEFQCRPMDYGAACAIVNWTYEPPYDFYNSDGSIESISELTNGTYQAVYREEDLVGFYCVGETAQVPAGREVGAYPGFSGSSCHPNGSTQVVDIGLGLRPDLTGRGFGSEFMNYVLRQVMAAYPVADIRLTVAVFNQRAITLYEKVAFVRLLEFDSHGTRFQTMVRWGGRNDE